MPSVTPTSMLLRLFAPDGFYVDMATADRLRLQKVAEKLRHRLRQPELTDDLDFLEDLAGRIGVSDQVEQARRAEVAARWEQISALQKRLIDVSVLLLDVSVLSQERADVARHRMKEVLPDRPNFRDIVNHDAFEAILQARIGHRRRDRFRLAVEGIGESVLRGFRW